MTITVKYLASLAEELHKSDDTINPDSAMTVDEIWQQLNPNKPIKTNTICSVNFEYATRNSIVSDGAEVAFFPPVTGG
ncbi:MAG: MoaD/ThiS family protein [Gammaproteobacteria bacterium]|nr:MoaD/ThiS family protein [Gammaproteobacteria bacterium]